MRHSKLEPASLASKSKAASVEFVRLGGVEVNVVFGAALSIVNVRCAGASTLPAVSTARWRTT